MSNPCSNDVHIQLKKDDTSDELEKITNKIVKDLEEEFCFIDVIYEEDGVIEVCMESKWTAPIGYFEDLSKKYNCVILGVAHEWGCGYVESFEINNK